jgi:CDP-glycerol glycerophosphotransferase (TagB/SpsB family)
MKRILLIALFSLINLFFCKSKNKITFYGRAKLNDNDEVLVRHLISRNFNKKYKIVLIVENEKDYLKFNKRNVEICTSIIPSLFHLFTSKFIFHSYGMSKASFRPFYGQIIFALWHGSGLKADGNMTSNIKRYPFTDSYILATSEFYKNVFKKCFGYSDKQFFISGYPRNDVLFTENNSLSKLGISKELYKKVFVFMPTFRRSDFLGKYNSTIDFPILNHENIQDFNEYLKEKKMLFIIKPHPAQNKIDLFNKENSNIKVYTNKELQNSNVELYELLRDIDVLLTDYSSVFTDFLLTNKPIGFVLDDIKDYKENRGFIIENPLDLMPGEKIYSLKELENFIKELIEERDNYEAERKKINELVNQFKDNNNCKRILDFVGIRV